VHTYYTSLKLMIAITRKSFDLIHQLLTPVSHQTLISNMSNSPSTATFSWERGPMKLLPLPDTKTTRHNPRAQAALELTLIHNTLIRAINSIYIQAPHIPLSEYTHFSSYALATYLGLAAHDSSSLFSEIARQMTDNTPLRAFDTPLTAWGNWLKSIPSRKNNFSAKICRGMMDHFMSTLHQYFQSVVQGIIQVSERDVDKVMKEYRNGVSGNMSKTEVLRVFVLNYDLRVGGKWK
jgi:hypothetical protein